MEKKKGNGDSEEEQGIERWGGGEGERKGWGKGGRMGIGGRQEKRTERDRDEGEKER